MTAQVKQSIIKTVNCLSNEFEFHSVYLYGSYYKGNYNADSDVDLAFFVDERYDLHKVLHKLLIVCSREEYDIQPQVFSMSEMKDSMGIVEEILENGIEIFGEGIWSDQWME